MLDAVYSGKSTYENSKQVSLLVLSDSLDITQQFLSAKLPSLDLFEWLIDNILLSICRSISLNEGQLVKNLNDESTEMIPLS